MQTIAVLSIKGGVGKTTLAVNLGAALSRLGKKVLLADLDPQNDLTQNLGVEPATTKGLEFFLTQDLSFKKVLRKYSETLHFIPSGKKLKELEISLSGFFRKNNNMNYLLRYAFKQVPDEYDYIILDCPNHPGLLNQNALAFVKKVFLPIQCQHLGLRGSRRTVFFVHKMQTFFNRELKISSVIPVMYDSRNRHSSEILSKLQNSYRERVTDTKIRVNVSLAEAPATGKTIFEYKPYSRGAQDFRSLAKEIISNSNNHS